MCSFRAGFSWFASQFSPFAPAVCLLHLEFVSSNRLSTMAAMCPSKSLQATVIAGSWRGKSKDKQEEVRKRRKTKRKWDDNIVSFQSADEKATRTTEIEQKARCYLF